ncbi:MAG: thioredoxin domain-containing protein [Deltaproteobacteria bacterium]|nr:thioredoxin domain-containing protein [Deltaproteobacteria bacterium]
MDQDRAPNRLIHESSPYLKQHAYNPVDWYPWGPEALERARQEDRPILLSIGYSTCHWCHVMAHECFENPQIAQIMNEHFVNIKVDREERPDLDEVYMNAVHLLTGRGGWPLTVFLTPDLKPFYGGTYFPPEDRAGLPGFPWLLKALSEAYHRKKPDINIAAQSLSQKINILGEIPEATQEPKIEVLDLAYQKMIQDFDMQNGGFGSAPKFPPSLDLDFMARYYYRTADHEVRDKLTLTLTRMARGGIYDQLRGGFHRYTVDGVWLIPHFEKMLYDNALLARRYLEAFQITSDPWFAQIARETLDYVLAEMTAPEGGFYAAQDADSEGVEGKFFVWTPEQIKEAVGPDYAELVTAAYGVTTAGNFEHGASVLHQPLSSSDLARRFSMSEEELMDVLGQCRKKLLAVRENRVRPHRDEQIITAWNGLMIAALAYGSQVLGEDRYYRAASKSARFILDNLLQEGHLKRIWAQGQASPLGFLDDYACLVAGLLDLFETDFEPGWLLPAILLTGLMEERFYDARQKLYLYTAHEHEQLIARPKNFFDQALPSGNSVAVHNLIRLFWLTENCLYQERARETLSRFQGLITNNPRALAYLLSAQEAYLAPTLALTLVGDPADTALTEMLAALYRRYLPYRRLVVKSPHNCEALAGLVAAVREYETIDDKPTAFVCHGFSCLEPVHTATELEAHLDKLPRP